MKPVVALDIDASASYSARHTRIRRSRGKARDQTCVGCVQQARDWSQIHGTDGLSVMDYEPRCRSCHIKYDGVAEKSSKALTGRRTGPLSDSTKAKISSANRNKPKSTAHKQKLAAATRMKWRDPTHKAMMVKSHTGNVASEETKAKMRESQKARRHREKKP